MTLDILHRIFLEHPRVSTDSRNIPEGGMFFALKGPNFDGNAFAMDALDKGAAYAVVDDPKAVSGKRSILVPDVLKCLQELATFHRHYCKARIVALTGSNGKTTTKELIAAVLAKKYKTIATRGNLNNHIGVPLTLLRLQTDTEMAVVEMGANHQGEIAFLCSLAQPDFGYITNFGKAHLEGFGGFEGVIRGKSEMYAYLKAAGKTIFMNADDPIQADLLKDYIKKVGFSTDNPQYFRIANLGAQPFVRMEAEGETIETQLIGAYNFPNCAVAALIGKYFNVPMPLVREALEAYSPENNRSQIIQRDGLRIILDAYNANPTSMTAALAQLEQLDAPGKIAILGDMFELGSEAAAEHLTIGQLALAKGFDRVLLVGENFYASGLPTDRFRTFAELSKTLTSSPLKAPATVLVKGSRGMALERVLDFL